MNMLNTCIFEKIKDNINFDDILISNGWYDIEPHNKDGYFRWAQTKSCIKVKPLKNKRYLTILFINNYTVKKISFVVKKVDGSSSTTFTKNCQLGETCQVKICLEDVNLITLESDSYYSPFEKGHSNDRRKLSVMVFNFIFEYENIKIIKSIKEIKQESYNNCEPNRFDEIRDINLENIKLPELSIYDQHIDVNLLNFDYDYKNLLFNSSIFEFENKKYIFARKSSFVTKSISDNTLELFEYPSLEKIKIKIKNEIDFEQYEDPRVFVYDNKIYVSCVNYTHDDLNIMHQKILVFDKNFNHIGNIHPKYGYNGKSLKENLGKEKNWAFFVIKNKLFCIYKINPHTILEFDWNGNLITEYNTNFDIKNSWKYGECRGGTNPILKNDVYHCFFHSSIPWKRGQRRYIMGHYIFNSEPPFNILKFDSEPILWGNEIDKKILPEINPPVVFPCGAILENDKFLVSFGFNDEKTGIIKI